MRIIKIPAMAAPCTAEIDNTLEAMQGIVGGYIEVVTVSKHLRMIVNEEGKLGAYLFNPFATLLFCRTHTAEDSIFGDVLVTRVDDSGEDFTDVTDDDVRSVIALIAAEKGGGGTGGGG